MEDIIKRILELDHIEQELTAKAEKIKADTENNIMSAKAEIKQDYINRARDRANLNVQQERDLAQSKWDEMEKSNESGFKKLDELYEQKFDIWVKNIVNNVINQ